jgi:hypothetical protein
MAYLAFEGTMECLVAMSKYFRAQLMNMMALHSLYCGLGTFTFMFNEVAFANVFFQRHVKLGKTQNACTVTYIFSTLGPRICL